MSNALNEWQKKSHLLWMKAWAERLANCNNCDTDYADAQAVIINDEKSCPNCLKPEDKSYYYCEEHGSPECCKE